ncbi:MAG: YqaE/Pmp3 family membrane protein [Bacteroidia bacterium]
MSVLEIIITILIPPLGVAMRFGLTSKFWINLLLTIFGYFPGLIHGFYVLASKPQTN